MKIKEIKGIAKVINQQITITKKEHWNGKEKCIKLSTLMWTAQDLADYFGLTGKKRHQFLKDCGGINY